LLKEQKHLKPESKFYNASKVLATDPRFKNVDEKDREEIFQDFIDQLWQQQKEEQ